MLPLPEKMIRPAGRHVQRGGKWSGRSTQFAMLRTQGKMPGRTFQTYSRWSENGCRVLGDCPRGSFSGCDRLMHRVVGEARDRLPWAHLIHQFGARAAVQGFDKCVSGLQRGHGMMNPEKAGCTDHLLALALGLPPLDSGGLQGLHAHHFLMCPLVSTGSRNRWKIIPRPCLPGVRTQLMILWRGLTMRVNP